MTTPPLHVTQPIPVLARRAQVMPAEWDRHDATWLAWPLNVRDWPGRFGPLPWVYAEIVRNVARGELVRLLVLDATHEKKVRRGWPFLRDRRIDAYGDVQKRFIDG